MFNFILFGNIDKNLVLFDDILILNFNTFSFFLWIKGYNFLTKKVGRIKVHSRNYIHCVLVHASHQARICSYCIEFGSTNWHFLSFLTLVNVGNKFKLWMSCFVSCLITFAWQHHGLSHMHNFLMGFYHLLSHNFCQGFVMEWKNVHILFGDILLQ
jgi:hypothetical protein